MPTRSRASVRDIRSSDASRGRRGGESLRASRVSPNVWDAIFQRINFDLFTWAGAYLRVELSWAAQREGRRTRSMNTSLGNIRRPAVGAPCLTVRSKCPSPSSSRSSSPSQAAGNVICSRLAVGSGIQHLRSDSAKFMDLAWREIRGGQPPPPESPFDQKARLTVPTPCSVGRIVTSPPFINVRSDRRVPLMAPTLPGHSRCITSLGRLLTLQGLETPCLLTDKDHPLEKRLPVRGPRSRTHGRWNGETSNGLVTPA